MIYVFFILNIIINIKKCFKLLKISMLYVEKVWFDFSVSSKKSSILSGERKPFVRKKHSRQKPTQVKKGRMSLHVFFLVFGSYAKETNHVLSGAVFAMRCAENAILCIQDR